MSDIIQLLPDSVANQIAAGEVIQRPASLIKELVENSVDAGSTEIKVIIKEAGKSRVQIIDNGSGMSETDARLCFERHATSKIRSANDLFSIRTMGFRGEAMASIAAVAQVELRTCRKEDKLGTEIKINGSKPESQEPVACKPGTNIIVKNLFFNVPARRKFLKSNSTELRHIVVEFQRIALSLPHIAFSLKHNNSEIYNLPAVDTRAKRIAGIFGKGILPNLVPVNTETSIVKIRGHIGKPEFARKTFGEQFFFVNGRFMRHPYLHKAVNQAYEDILPPDMIPSYFLYFEVDPSAIDINIHPTKTEIKFEDERSVWQILNASIREALGKFNVVPSIDFDQKGSIDIPVTKNGDDTRMPEIKINPGFNPFEEENRKQNWEDIYKGTLSREQAGNEKNKSERDNYREGVREENDGTRIWEKLEEDQQLFQGKDEAANKLMQLKGRYILSPVKSGLMIIDQKRAHERILFEHFLGNEQLNRLPSQKSMFPVEIKLNTADHLVLTELLPELERMGFEIKDKEGDTISINATPAALGQDNPASILETLLEEYKSSGTNLEEEQMEKLARSLAVSSSINYGKALSQEEMRDIVDRLFLCSSPNFSPRGKAVMSIISLDDLEDKLR